MEKEKIEQLLREARSRIYVDEKLKVRLRKSLLKKRKPIWKMPAIYAAIAATFLFTFILSNYQGKYVTAEKLMITNAISFLDIGSGEITASSHHKGNLYLSIRNQGIFLYTKNGLTKLTDSTADSMSFNSKGDKLLFSEDGEIAQLLLKTGAQKQILNGSSVVRYHKPIWKDGDEIYVTKENKHRKQIILLSLKTKKEKVITDGSAPAILTHESQLVFERNGNIIMKDMKDGQEKMLDEGREPSISKDGRYISYIKEENNLEDVWIIDANLKTKKKVTANLVLENKKQGLYHYSSPFWDSEKHHLYLLKKRNLEETETVQLMKIELGKEQLTAKATVERFLQALIVRDDDYAKSLMKNPPEFLTYSNPHFIGYQVLHSKQKENHVVVQAEVYRADTARPYYSVSQYEFKLIKGENGYIIRRATELNIKEMTALDLENLELISMELNHNEIVPPKSKESLFSVHDIPKTYIKNKNIRLGSLVWNQKKDQVIFSVQEMRDETNPSTDETNFSAVTLWTYDRNNKNFTFLDRIDSLNNQKNTVIDGMTISPDGKYLAVDISIESQLDEHYVLIYDMDKKKLLTQLDEAHSLFWQGEHFVIQKKNNYQSMLYYYNPKTNETSF